MPTYEYKCSKCGNHFDRFQSIKEKALSKGACPVCGGDVVRMISGGAGLIFKGPGFYATDYRSGKYQATAESKKK
jgi:putative FmdB family regulatory protein